jgi:hypothetical protein
MSHENIIVPPPRYTIAIANNAQYQHRLPLICLIPAHLSSSLLFVEIARSNSHGTTNIQIWDTVRGHEYHSPPWRKTLPTLLETACSSCVVVGAAVKTAPARWQDSPDELISLPCSHCLEELLMPSLKICRLATNPGLSTHSCCLAWIPWDNPHEAALCRVR